MAVAPPGLLLDEITDFLVTGPSADQIIVFQPSEGLNERLHELLEKNREETISTEERLELNRFVEMGHLLTILKAKARLKLASEN